MSPEKGRERRASPGHRREGGDDEQQHRHRDEDQRVAGAGREHHRRNHPRARTTRPRLGAERHPQPEEQRLKPEVDIARSSVAFIVEIRTGTSLFSVRTLCEIVGPSASGSANDVRTTTLSDVEPTGCERSSPWCWLPGLPPLRRRARSCRGLCCWPAGLAEAPEAARWQA